MSLFQDLYGYVPPHLAFPSSTTTSMDVLEDYLKARDSMLDIIKESLHQAQAIMKLYADSSRVEKSFAKGDLVYLKLQPYRQASVSLRKNFKLLAKYYGPSKILQKIGAVAYKLQLPSHSRIHLVFHVSHLKKHIGMKHTPSPILPVVDLHSEFIMLPEKVLKTISVLRGNKLARQALIQWTNSSVEDATWEDFTNIQSNYPRFFLEDKDNFQG
ncbi:uncharacterized protein LOC113324583 [Papaver somniferum]|uniref:uncharacterized protein LOC113324583 n=1 Tax=Papaver somniferum TaxID=3469 RepID=UPI000E705CED|nr:uncharacterized protein LOC113324583 [Papaver somniferum]